MLNPAFRTVFIVWGSSRQGPRSRVLAKALGLGAPQFISAGNSRGVKSAPMRYARQMVATWQFLRRTRPRVVIVQSPPSFAVWACYLWGQVSRARYIVDAHNAAFDRPEWTRPRALYRRLGQSALMTIVTNPFEADQVHALGGTSFILPDPPATYPVSGRYPLRAGFCIAVVGSYSPDEPLQEVFAAATRLPDVHFYITGDTALAPRHQLEDVPTNVTITHYLSDADYYALLASVDAVMCLCTGAHTWQGGAGEGLWLGKPLIVSDMSILRAYFSAGTVFVANKSEEIAKGVTDMRTHCQRYKREIIELQQQRRVEGCVQIQALVSAIHQAMETEP